MLTLKILEYFRIAFRFLWVVMGISCCLMTYFVILSFLKTLSLLFCICSTRNCCNSLYLKVEAKMYKWLLSFISCWLAASGYEVFEHGDDINTLAGDRAFVISNHLDSADVPVIMHKFINTPEVAENMMWIMDKSYRLTFLGWVAACHGDFFIKVGKQFRESELVRLSAHVQNVFHRRNRRWIVLFPEGGFLEQRRKVNNAFTLERGLPKLQYITLPRFGALTAIYSAFKECQEENAMPKWLIDMTMAYPPKQPFPTLGDVFLGRQFPVMNINLCYRVYRVSDIPFSDLGELTKWMYSLYYEKEAMLDHFYKFGSFPSVTSYSISGMPKLDKSVLRYSTKYYVKLNVFFLGAYVFLSFFFAMILRAFVLIVARFLKSPPESQ